MHGHTGKPEPLDPGPPLWVWLQGYEENNRDKTLRLNSTQESVVHQVQLLQPSLVETGGN